MKYKMAILTIVILFCLLVSAHPVLADEPGTSQGPLNPWQTFGGGFFAGYGYGSGSGYNGGYDYGYGIDTPFFDFSRYGSGYSDGEYNYSYGYGYVGFWFGY